MKILPINKWNKEDKIRLKALNKFRITPIEAWHISWAIWHKYMDLKRDIEDMIECKKCWKKNNPNSDYDRCLRENRKHLKEMDRLNTFFHPYHNMLGEDYEYTTK